MVGGLKKGILVLALLVCLLLPPVSAAPTAVFSGTPLEGGIPLAVTFTNASTGVTAPVSSYYWSFGDGATSTSENPTHTYTAAGTYTVCFNITDAAGSDWENKTAYVTVSTIYWPDITEILGGVTNLFPTVMDMVIGIFPIVVIITILGFVVAFIDRILGLVKF